LGSERPEYMVKAHKRRINKQRRLMNQDDLFSRLVRERQRFVGDLRHGFDLNVGDEFLLTTTGQKLRLIRAQQEIGEVHRPEVDLVEVVRTGPESTRLCRVVECRPLSNSVVLVLCD
jgi:hypothetical protein